MRPLSFLLLLATSPAAVAQSERYELGVRLRAFETLWEVAGEAKRARALKAIRPVTTQFLTFQLTAAARTLDEAAHALRGSGPPDLWADSLAVAPAAWLVDADQKALDVTLKPLYTPGGDAPAFRVRGSGGTVTLDERPKTFPHTLTLGLAAPVAPPDEARLEVAVTAGGSSATRHLRIARVERLRPRLRALRAAVEGFPETPTIEQATAADRAGLLSRLAAGEVPETDLPSARLLAEAEAMAAPGAKPFFTRDRAGQHWLTVPTAGGKRTPCRLLVPEKLAADKPVPLVVALHGMGGSENLFFDGYGAGCVAERCETRGWLMVSPRAGLGFLAGPPPVADIVARLAERYPIDPARVFLVGHSMGAAQAVDLAGRPGAAFAAAAALGGGGRVKEPKSWATRPTFVGIGTEDFAYTGAKELRATLAAAGATAVAYREYPGVEHSVVVRAAADDLFAFLDGVARAGSR